LKQGFEIIPALGAGIDMISLEIEASQASLSEALAIKNWDCYFKG
jgi:hypothetical protein